MATVRFRGRYRTKSTRQEFLSRFWNAGLFREKSISHLPNKWRNSDCSKKFYSRWALDCSIIFVSFKEVFPFPFQYLLQVEHEKSKKKYFFTFSLFFILGTLPGRMVFWIRLRHPQFNEYVAVVDRSRPRVTNDACQCSQVSLLKVEFVPLQYAMSDRELSV